MDDKPEQWEEWDEADYLALAARAVVGVWDNEDDEVWNDV